MHEKRTAGSVWKSWTAAAADGVRCARVRREINFLLTSETAPCICKHTVYDVKTQTSHTATHFATANITLYLRKFTL